MRLSNLKDLLTPLIFLYSPPFYNPRFPIWSDPRAPQATLQRLYASSSDLSIPDLPRWPLGEPKEGVEMAVLSTPLC